MRQQLSGHAPSAYAANDATYNPDDPGFANVLPRQSEHEGILVVVDMLGFVWIGFSGGNEAFRFAGCSRCSSRPPPPMSSHPTCSRSSVAINEIRTVTRSWRYEDVLALFRSEEHTA